MAWGLSCNNYETNRLDKKVSMITWEELDNTSSDEETKEEEEVKLYLMVDTTLEGSDSKSNEEVNINKTLKPTLSPN